MAFGVSTDPFGITYAGADWKQVSYSEEPVASNANVQDENGDNVCETVFGEAKNYTAEYQYAGTGANVVFPTLVLGTDTVNDILVTGATVATSNTERPKLTVTGETAFGESASDYTVAFPTVVNAKKAAAMGFEVTTGTRLNSSTWAITAQTAYVLDEDGERVLADVYGARIEASGDLVSCTGVAAATAASGYTLSQAVSAAEENQGYGSGTINVFKNQVADIPAT
jgi:hypothetical protein